MHTGRTPSRFILVNPCVCYDKRMSGIPDTRQSLIQRIKNVDDSAAWLEFASIYRPAVLRFALRRGMQSADAEDVTQRVFVSVTRAMQDWEASERRGSFRAWLLTVTKNAVINAVTRQPKAKASGGTDAMQQLQQQADEVTLTEELDWEYRRAEFRRAANEVQSEFEPGTWQAFWLTAVEEQSIADVAKELNKSVGSVYAARSRVMKRIQERVESLP